MQNIEPEVVPVSIAVIEQKGKVFISKRSDRVDLAGLWEFPGGKVEANESNEQALIRECQEEVGITPLIYKPLIALKYTLKNKIINLSVFYVTQFTGQPFGKENQQTKWVTKKKLEDIVFPEINQHIIQAINLPSIYCIVPKIEKEVNEKVYLASLEKQIDKHKIEILQFRNSWLENKIRRALFLELQTICKKNNCLLIENINENQLYSIETNHIHLTSKALNIINGKQLTGLQLVGASCHNLKELQLAESKGCHYALLSPIKKTYSHPNAKPIGWHGFKRLVQQVNIPVYSLGGLKLSDLELSTKNGGQGVAGISFCKT